MGKCAKCSKLVSKKSPGLQCSKCSKWIHAKCAMITAEQLSALNATDSIDWKCRSCTGSIRPKRLSCIMPDAEEDEATDTEAQSVTNNEPVCTKQILNELRREIRETIRLELQQTLSYFSDKVDEYEAKVIKYEQDMKAIENQQIELKNTCKNLALKNDLLEQKINVLEQTQINNQIEICGIKEEANENLTLIVGSVCSKIDQNPQSILKMYRKKPTRPNVNKTANYAAPPVITVVLSDGSRDQWIAKAKENTILAKDIGAQGEGKVFIRESLTPSTAYLLWKAKQELKETNLCKYVWIKQGIIRAKKADGDKVHYIRSYSDVQRMLSMFKE